MGDFLDLLLLIGDLYKLIVTALIVTVIGAMIMVALSLLIILVG